LSHSSPKALICMEREGDVSASAEQSLVSVETIAKGSNEDMLSEQTRGKSVQDLLPKPSPKALKKLPRSRIRKENNGGDSDGMNDEYGRKRYSIDDETDENTCLRKNLPLGNPKDLHLLSENLLGELPSHIDLDNFLTAPCSQRNTLDSRRSEGRRSTRGTANGRLTERSSFGRLTARSSHNTHNRDQEVRRTWDPEAEDIVSGSMVVVAGAANILRGVQGKSKLGPEDASGSPVKGTQDVDCCLMTELVPNECSSRLHMPHSLTLAGAYSDTGSRSVQQLLVETPTEPIAMGHTRSPRLLRIRGTASVSAARFASDGSDYSPRPLEPPTRVPTDEAMERGSTTTDLSWPHPSLECETCAT